MFCAEREELGGPAAEDESTAPGLRGAVGRMRQDGFCY